MKTLCRVVKDRVWQGPRPVAAAHDGTVPFTLSHIAAVLPVAGGRRWLPLAPAAIGSMVPDVGLFLGAERLRALAHTPAGILTVDVPLAVVLALVWHHLLRPTVLALTPPLAARWPPDRPTTRGVGWALRWALAGLVGIVSHLLLDAFTHRGEWGVAHVAGLLRVWHGVVVVDWLQYLGSVVGAVVLAAAAARWWRTTPPRRLAPATSVTSRLVVLLLLAVVTAGGALVAAAPAARLVLAGGLHLTQWNLRWLLTDLAIGGACSAAGTLLVVAVARRVVTAAGRTSDAWR